MADSTVPPKSTSTSDTDSDQDSSESADSEFPITQSVQMRQHAKTVSCLALDPAGARLVSGSYDYTVNLWDFAGMDTSLRPFRTVEPFGEYQIRDVQFSHSGDRFLVASGACVPKLFDRDGDTLAEYAKGDMYLRDLRRTAGHTMALTQVGWHPTNKTRFYTASLDGTVRFWDTERTRKHQQIILVRPKGRPTRNPVHAALYTSDASSLVCATGDGSLSVWSTKGNPSRPLNCVDQAHMTGSEVTSLALSIDQHTLASRATDDTVKLWDLRQFKKPLAARSGLTLHHPETRVIFSPNDRYIVTGTGTSREQQQGGQLVFLKKDDLEEVDRYQEESKASVVSILWHSRINQIVYGCGGTGTIRALYDPSTSVRGVKLVMDKQPKKRDAFVGELKPTIVNPHSLPMFRAQQPDKRKSGSGTMIHDRVPERPVSGHGHGGRIGSNEVQRIMKTLMKEPAPAEDPREALLKYAQEAEENPYWITPAYTSSSAKKATSEHLSARKKPRRD
ncbi:hypothetical protein IWQ61_002103 [Dispira simplex]|nr:hypothetical protein IWQ61_002103 [Dispira simplex]